MLSFSRSTVFIQCVAVKLQPKDHYVHNLSITGIEHLGQRIMAKYLALLILCELKIE